MNRNQLIGFLVSSSTFCQRPRTVGSCATAPVAAARRSAAAMVSFATGIFTWNIPVSLAIPKERNGHSIWPFHERADRLVRLELRPDLPWPTRSKVAGTAHAAYL